MTNKNIVALAGGVGGAKLVFGLSKIVDTSHFSVIVNTGDDFSYYGLRVSPDIDSVVYSLAGVSDPINGYGRKGDTFVVNRTLEELGEKPWFTLGDMDLTLNLLRTQLLNSGKALSEVTKMLCGSLGVDIAVYPMTDDQVYTKIQTVGFGDMDFQEYFVRNHFQPKVKNIYYQNSESANLSVPAKTALEDADVIVICPSNPWLSIFPILSLPYAKDLLSSKLVIAVSPIIGQNAIKGPTAKLFKEFGQVPNALGIAKLYNSLLNILVIDKINSTEVNSIEALGIKTYVTDIIMADEKDKIRLAKEIVDLIDE